MELGKRLSVHADVLESDALKPYIFNRINDFQTVFDSLIAPSQHEYKVHARAFPETALRVDYRNKFGKYNNYLFGEIRCAGCPFGAKFAIDGHLC